MAAVHHYSSFEMRDQGPEPAVAPGSPLLKSNGAQYRRPGLAQTMRQGADSMGRRADHTPEELRRMALDAARRIVRKEGLNGLTTRKIAKEIGYTVGTLYQLFANVDQLIEQMNGETLDDFRAYCEKVDFDGGTAQSLRSLVETYVVYTRRNRNLWNAIFDHKLPTGYRRQEVYENSVRKLVGIVERAIAPLFKPDQQDARRHDANLLWACLYGVAALAVSDRLAKDENLLRLIDTLIEIYVAARERPRHTRIKSSRATARIR